MLRGLMWPWLTRCMHCSPRKTQKARDIQRGLSLASVSAGQLSSQSGGTRCNSALSISTSIMSRQPPRKCPFRDEVTALLCIILECCFSESLSQASTFWCAYDSLTCYTEECGYIGERVKYGEREQDREWQDGLVMRETVLKPKDQRFDLRRSSCVLQ